MKLCRDCVHYRELRDNTMECNEMTESYIVMDCCEVASDYVNGGVYGLCQIARSAGPCYPDAKLFEPREDGR